MTPRASRAGSSTVCRCAASWRISHAWRPSFEVTHAIIAMPAVSHRVRRHALRLATEAGLKVMTVPSFDDIVSGKVTVSQLREVELDDLLGRDPVVLDGAGLSGLLSDAPVMVTGAGGSIGSELCRQIARFRPARLILFEVSEFALYRIEQELRAANPELQIVCAVGDVRNSARVEQILRRLPAAACCSTPRHTSTCR